MSILEGGDDLDLDAAGEPDDQEIETDADDSADDQSDEEIEGEDEELDEDGNPVEKAKASEDDDEEPRYPVKVNGKEQKVSLKELREGYSRTQDYHEKNQTLARDREAVAQARAAAEQYQQGLMQQAQLQEQLVEEIAEVKGIDKRIAQFDAMQPAQWMRIREDDPDRYESLRLEYQSLGSRRQTALNSLNAKHHELTLAAEQQAATRLEEGRRAIARDIPGWNNEMASKVVEYAKTEGFVDQELGSIHDPRQVKVLAKAMRATQLEAENAQLKKALEKTKKGAAKPAQTAEVKPSAKVPPGKSNGLLRITGKSRAEDNMSDEAWFKKRLQEDAKKRAAMR